MRAARGFPIGRIPGGRETCTKRAGLSARSHRIHVRVGHGLAGQDLALDGIRDWRQSGAWTGHRERAAGELGHAAQWAQQNGYPIYQSGTEPKFRKSGNEVKARSITAISPLSTKAKNRREEVVLSFL